jgi:hypothetical protein
MIQRIFHPIGQGAFYSERHDHFNMVFDCGTWNKTKLSEKVVKQSFREEDIVNVLFISHFDADHVNRIETLKNHCRRIDKVIMPLLHRNEILFLSNYYRIIGVPELVTLVESPEEYFGTDTSIIRVEPSDITDSQVEGTSLEIENLPRQIKSGTNIRIPNIDWIFVPFNHEYRNRHNDLLQLFIANKIDINKFTNDLEYALDLRNIAKDLYNKLSGGINQNSMLLYSGPLNRHHWIKEIAFYNQNYIRVHPFFRHHYNDYERVACVYTGDGDLNETNIKNIYHQYWDNVGTIQIPHHGDIKAFNKQILNDRFYQCPISVGLTNIYGHPSGKVICDILSTYSDPILITERPNSVFAEFLY